MLVQLLHIVAESLVNADLHELFQGNVLVRSVLQVNIFLLGNEQVRLRKVLLVLRKLLLEEGHITTGVFFTQVAQLSLMLVIQLRLLIAEVLLLGLYDYMQLGLLTLDLLN